MPAQISLGETELFGSQNYKADVTVTIWDYGVLSVLFQIQLLPEPVGILY